MKRWMFVVGSLTVLTLSAAATCQPIPKSDPGTPTLEMTAYSDDGTGKQGLRQTINPGRTLTVDGSWLSTGKADVRVWGREDPGVTKVRVTGFGGGSCSAKNPSNGSQPYFGNFFNNFFPVQEVYAPDGTVISQLPTHILDFALQTCGTHSVYHDGKSLSLDFNLLGGRWKLHAVAENCCGGNGEADFTVVIN